MSAIASIAQFSDLCEIADMPGDAATTLYDRLLAVKPDGLSFNAWALRAGVNRTIFSDARKRGNLTHDSLAKLLDAVDVSWAEFDAGVAPGSSDEQRVKTEVSGTGMSVKDVDRAWRGIPRAKPVPLLGSAIGGEWDGDDSVEMTELHLSEVFDYLARPPSVEHDPGAYAITIVGDSMAPRFEPGERAIASPRASVSIGDDAIVQLRGEGSDRIVQVLIKRIARRTAKFVELRQFNPEVTFTVPVERIAAIHRVMGRI